MLQQFRARYEVWNLAARDEFPPGIGSGPYPLGAGLPGLPRAFEFEHNNQQRRSKRLREIGDRSNDLAQQGADNKA